MKYVVGIDCGGTKTIAQAYSLDGKLLETFETGFGNVTVDYQKGINHITECIHNIYSILGKEKCVALTLGIAGIDSGGMKEKVHSDLSILHPSVHILNDGQLAHYAILKGADGITVTAGTGSVILGLSQNEWYRVGGWGHLLGDEGSAYSIALQSIKYCLHQYDKGCEADYFAKEVLSFFRVTTVFELSKKIYRLNKGEIASLASHIAKIYDHNLIAQEIITQASQELGKQLLEMIEKIPLEEPIFIGLNGSLIEKNKHILSSLTIFLEENEIHYQLLKKQAPCTIGAYYLYKRNEEN